MSPQELLPCPFCGIQPKSVGVFGMEGAEHPMDNGCYFRGATWPAHQWNRRPPSPQGSRSEAEGSNPPSSPQVLEGDETLREALDLDATFWVLLDKARLSPDLASAHAWIDKALAQANRTSPATPQPRPQAPVDGVEPDFREWWNEYFAKYQYGREEAANAKAWAKAGWFAALNLVAREGSGSPKGSPGGAA